MTNHEALPIYGEAGLFQYKKLLREVKAEEGEWVEQKNKKCIDMLSVVWYYNSESRT